MPRNGNNKYEFAFIFDALIKIVGIDALLCYNNKRMLFKGLVNSLCFKDILNSVKNGLNHSYLFYSNDMLLNENMAYLFAMSIICEKQTACFECENCKRSLLLSHPDITVYDKPNIQVSDISEIISSAPLKPMMAQQKIYLIKNADNLTEICQNKLLKTLEEPCKNVIFILTATDINKLLPTVLSRVQKLFCKLEDIESIRPELANMKSDESSFDKINLTDIIRFSDDGSYSKVVKKVKNLITSLNKSSSIPSLTGALQLNTEEKKLFFQILENLYVNLFKKLNNLQYNSVWDDTFEIVEKQYNALAVNKILLHIQEAYKKFMANVNFNYVIDLLLFDILKERFLCR